MALVMAAAAALALVGAAPSAVASPAAAPHQATSAPPPAQTGKFVRTDLHRILDTRVPIGVATAGKVAGGTNIRVPVGLPAGDVKAVVMNVTVTEPTDDSHLTVYPDGTPLPTASNLNFTAGQTIPNAVTVPVSNGFVDFYNNSGSTHVVADLAGYYTDNASVPGSSYVPVSPARVLDTRPGGTGPTGPVSEGGTLNLKVAGAGGVPATGATAVVLNVTATGTTSDSYLTVFPHGTDRPSTSNLNWTAGETIPNLVTVPLGGDGSIDLFNHIGSTDVVADVFGYYESAPTGAAYSATGPKRMVDTRSSNGFHALSAGATMNLPLAMGGLGTTKVSAVVLNVTATNATDDSFLTVFPGNGTQRPSTSNLNFHAGQTIPNLVIVPVDDSGLINVYNHVGSVDVIVDIFGYFTLPQGGPTNLSVGFGTPFSTCAGDSPGNWVAPSSSDGVSLYATSPRLDNNLGPVNGWLQVVITAPDGSTASYSSGVRTGDYTPTSAYVGTLGSGAYSWYAYETDGTLVSPPSRLCYFRVDADSAITGVTVTSNGVAGQIFQGQPLTFNLSATSTGTTDGRTIAGFCYSVDIQPAVNCSQAPAVNGTASVVINAGSWGSHSLYVQPFTVSGRTIAAQPYYTFYVRSQ